MSGTAIQSSDDDDDGDGISDGGCGGDYGGGGGGDYGGDDMVVVVMTLKTRDESPRPIVAMSPPSTDVALRPILCNSRLGKVERDDKRNLSERMPEKKEVRKTKPIARDPTIAEEKERSHRERRVNLKSNSQTWRLKM